MECPRCEAGTMVERERNGVVIDVCERCRGVWLDRGELEKLMARTRQEIEQYERAYQPRDDYEPPSSDRRYEQRGGYDSPHGHPGGKYKKPHKKKGFFEMFEIFD